MKSNRSPLIGLLSMALVAGCGARSAVECFGESCRADGDDVVGAEDAEDGEQPGPMRPIGGRPIAGGRPMDPGTRPPEQLPTDTPIDRPIPEPPSTFPNRFCEDRVVFGASMSVFDRWGLEALEGCEIIEGDLTISGLSGTDLGPLSSLRRVDGILSIANFSGSLAGLASLNRVGAFSLEHVDVPTLEPLGGVREFGGSRGDMSLTILSSAGFTNLRGLEGMAAPVIGISDNPALLSLDGLAPPERVESIQLLRNANLQGFDALLPIRQAGTIEIEGTPLTSLDALSNLQVIGSLAVVNDLSLVSTSGLGRLESADVLYLDDVGLSTIASVGPKLSIGTLVIQNNPRLLDIDAFGLVESLGELSVINNPELTRLPEFALVGAVDQVVIRDNVRLQSGPLFPSSTRIEDVSIAQNPSLTQLLGLSTVREARSIEILENANLAEIDLGALESVRRLDIRCNAALPESSLEPLRSVTGQVRISGNLGSPSPCP